MAVPLDCSAIYNIGLMHSSAILDSKRGLPPTQVLDNRFSMVNCCVPQCNYGPAFRPDLPFRCIPNDNTYIYI